MLLIDSLAEERIQRAIRRGELADLPGRGQPLPPEDFSGVPEELRAAYRLLKNAGCLPPELSLRNEISRVENLLHRVDTDCEQQGMRRRLCLLQARLALHGREINLLTREADYRDRLIRRMARAPIGNDEVKKTGGGPI